MKSLSGIELSLNVIPGGGYSKDQGLCQIMKHLVVKLGWDEEICERLRGRSADEDEGEKKKRSVEKEVEFLFQRFVCVHQSAETPPWPETSCELGNLNR